MKLLILPVDPKLRNIVILSAAVVLAVVSVFLFSIRYLYSALDNIQVPVVIEVTPGSSLSRVATELSEAGYLQYPQLFTGLARWRGVANSIKTGEYEIAPGLSPAELLDKMVDGETIQYRVTLVEGWTFAQALTAIAQSEKIEVELAAADYSDITRLLELDVDSPEGMLFPDTYFYTKGTTDLDLLRRANNRLQQVLDSQWEIRLGALPYDDAYDALVMASIIEKESARESERGHIAGVFIRRLERGMRLQSDPTVIYGLGDSFTGDLRRADLTAASPYNTYRIQGLPPTPIALAGLESITASLHPLPSDYLYFVAKGDGSHHFSSSLEEHNEAVILYQLQQ